MTRLLKHLFTLTYTILLQLKEAGVPDGVLKDKLKDCKRYIFNAYLHGEIMLLSSTDIFWITDLGHPVRQETNR